MKKGIFCLFSLFVLAFLFNLTISSSANQTNQEQQTNQDQNVTLLTDTKSAILIEINTGKILYEQNAHEKRPPASMTKIMSIYLVTEAIQQGRIKMEDIVTISAHAASMGGSQVWLEENEQMSVEDLYKCMVIGSANDATVALAELVAGSEELFASEMNKRVKEWGLKNTAFKDVTGLTDDMDEGHYSTAYDMAMISRRLLLDYGPFVLPFTSTYEDYVREDTDDPFWLVNTNRLVKHVEGIDGLKTGWTRVSGYNLTATMKRDDMRLISTLMGNSTSAKRNFETVKLLNYGFSVYEVKEYRPKDYKVDEYESLFFKPQKVDIITKDPIYFVVKKGTELEGYKDRYEMNINQANYQPGDVVGKYQVLRNNKVVYEVDLTVANQVERVNLFDLYLRGVTKVLFG